VQILVELLGFAEHFAAAPDINLPTVGSARMNEVTILALWKEVPDRRPGIKKERPGEHPGRFR